MLGEFSLLPFISLPTIHLSLPWSTFRPRWEGPTASPFVISLPLYMLQSCLKEFYFNYWSFTKKLLISIFCFLDIAVSYDFLEGTACEYVECHEEEFRISWRLCVYYCFIELFLRIDRVVLSLLSLSSSIIFSSWWPFWLRNIRSKAFHYDHGIYMNARVVA